jgi:hypothetical protein
VGAAIAWTAPALLSTEASAFAADGPAGCNLGNCGLNNPCEVTLFCASGPNGNCVCVGLRHRWDLRLQPADMHHDFLFNQRRLHERAQSGQRRLLRYRHVRGGRGLAETRTDWGAWECVSSSGTAEGGHR